MAGVQSNHSWLDSVERGVAQLPDMAGEGTKQRLSMLLKRPIRSHQTSDAVRGVLAIATGVAAIAFPEESLTALLVVFGVYVGVDAILELATAAATGTHRLRLVVQAAANVAVIVAAIASPDVTRSVALTLLAVWVVVMGALRVRDALDFSEGFHMNAVLLALALLAIVAGVDGIKAPGDNITIVILNVWIFTILHGVMLIAHRRGTEQPASTAPTAATSAGAISMPGPTPTEPLS